MRELENCYEEAQKKSPKAGIDKVATCKQLNYSFSYFRAVVRLKVILVRIQKVEQESRIRVG